ncbi:hypothetical protein JOC37_001315 [Desulfohalotomaculum tongense]|uniref:hypothetical protein n=1 Tax=Desulforadius tongensis TaxID=1216062 RepID=UPI001956A7E7|nr:hypothetical protein [Desulforadius tongensis]MBM7854935.1 hypothetical protein [Desulforadius tongensis]
MTIYQHAEAYKYETLSKMAVKGGLTASDRQELIKKLINLGADPETIKITGSSPTVYHPGEVTLRIEFMPKDFNSFTAKTVINGSPSQGSETVRIGVEGSAISSKTED